jgi:hypothetical protein
MKETGITVSPKRRVAFLVVGMLMLALWGWSLVPPIENWNNPYEDGFSYVGVFYATPIYLPVGFILLTGAIIGHGRWARRHGILDRLWGAVHRDRVSDISVCRQLDGRLVAVRPCAAVANFAPGRYSLFATMTGHSRTIGVNS